MYTDYSGCVVFSFGFEILSANNGSCFMCSYRFCVAVFVFVQAMSLGHPGLNASP